MPHLDKKAKTDFGKYYAVVGNRTFTVKTLPLPLLTKKRAKLPLQLLQKK